MIWRDVGLGVGGTQRKRRGSGGGGGVRCGRKMGPTVGAVDREPSPEMGSRPRLAWPWLTWAYFRGQLRRLRNKSSILRRRHCLCTASLWSGESVGRRETGLDGIDGAIYVVYVVYGVSGRTISTFHEMNTLLEFNKIQKTKHTK